MTPAEHGRIIDSGSGTTVHKNRHWLYGNVAEKVFNLTGSEQINLNTLRDYQQFTNHLAKKVRDYRPDLIKRSFTLNGRIHHYHWLINPILEVKLNSEKEPTTVSPWTDGQSLGEILESDDPSTHPNLKVFLRSEFTRFKRLLEFDYPHSHLRLLALNVLISPVDNVHSNLVVTNLREYINNRNPIALFNR